MGADINDVVNTRGPDAAGEALLKQAQKIPALKESFPGLPGNDYLSEVDGKDFWTVKIPEIRWAVPEVLREGLGVLMGAQKTGKSTLLTDMALSITTGGRFLNYFPVNQGDVFYLNYEDDLNDLRNRAAALGYSGVEFPCLKIKFDAPRQDDGGMDQRQEWAESHPGRRLLIIDPFIKFRRHRYPHEKGLDSYQLDYAVVGEIHSVAVKYGFSVLIVQHEKKADDSDWVFKSSGSVALTAAASSILRHVKKRGQNNATLAITGRGIKEREYALKGDGLTWRYCGEAEEYTKSQNVISIAAFLRKNGESTPKEVAAVLGMNQNSAKSLLWRHSNGANAEFYVNNGRYGVRTSYIKKNDDDD
jgi:hypothetical protein